MTCAVGTASTIAKCEHALMPRPKTERQTLEHERDVELPPQLAGYRRELDATPPTFRERRERFEWQIRRAQKRLGEVEARLARSDSEARYGADP
jgi:hypothetical protein